MHKKIASAIFLALCLSIFGIQRVYAVPPLPFSPYGTVKVNNLNIPDGSVIAAWCAGVKYMEDQTEPYNGESFYSMQIPGDDLSTPGIKEGCTQNETVSFTIQGIPADQTAVFQNGVSGTLNLTATVVREVNVTKTVNWNGMPPVSSKTFEVCVSGPSYSTPNCQQVGYTGGMLTWGNVLPGDYVVTETNPGSEWSVVISGSPGTIPFTGGTANISITNSRKLGNLQVTKTVNWSGITPDPAQNFQVCIQGASYPIGNESGACKNFNSTNGLVQSWTNLIPGSYNISETNPGSQWTVILTGSPAMVPVDGGTVTGSISNTRKLGSLNVIKTVNWNGFTPDTGKTFEVCIQGPSFSIKNCKIIDFDGGGLNWTNLIPGSYTVTETNPGTQWEIVITGTPANVPLDGGAGSVNITNSRKLGTIEVVKMVDWKGVIPNPAQTFEICITGPSYPTPNCKIAGYSGGTLSWPNLMPGSYTVTETNPGIQWQVSISGSPAVIIDTGNVVSVSITNIRRAQQLLTGWNLISLPLHPNNSSLPGVLSSVSGSFDLVYAYEGCQPSSPWQMYKVGAPGPVNTLFAMDKFNGYWLYATSPVSLTIDGTQTASTSISLCAGWNLIGYPSWVERPITNALSGISGAYTVVWTFIASDTSDPWKTYNPTAPPFQNDLLTMQPWQGYWIYMNQPATLVIDAQ